MHVDLVDVDVAHLARDASDVALTLFGVLLVSPTQQLCEQPP